MQDDLGDYNDMQVQQRELRDTAQELFSAGGANAPVLLTMGRLVDRLESQEKAARQRVVEQVGRFVTARTGAELGRLLATREETSVSGRGSS